MCFTNKRKRNWIQKNDLIPDRVQPPDRVGYGGVGRYTGAKVTYQECKVASRNTPLSP